MSAPLNPVPQCRTLKCGKCGKCGRTAENSHLSTEAGAAEMRVYRRKETRLDEVAAPVFGRCGKCGKVRQGAARPIGEMAENSAWHGSCYTRPPAYGVIYPQTRRVWGYIYTNLDKLNSARAREAGAIGPEGPQPLSVVQEGGARG